MNDGDQLYEENVLRHHERAKFLNVVELAGVEMLDSVSEYLMAWEINPRLVGECDMDTKDARWAVDDLRQQILDEATTRRNNFEAPTARGISTEN